MTLKRYGWKQDLDDERDYKLVLDEVGLVLPTKVDMRENCPPIYDQGALGSCTYNAIGALFQYQHNIQGLGDFFPSRLFGYYNERVMEGTVNRDTGARIRTGIQTLIKIGVCSEEEWAYDIKKFAVKPPDICYENAKKNIATTYRRLTQTTEEMKMCLAKGDPFVGGFNVYSEFEGKEVAKSGILKMPQMNEKFRGGHAIMVVGYDDSMESFIVRNSWGDDWGMKGYFMMPYDYLADPRFGSDFWMIENVL